MYACHICHRTIHNSLSYSFKHKKHYGGIFIVSVFNLFYRYVREWLFSMVAAKIVFITDDNKYYIPADCKTKTSKSLMATLISAAAPLTKDVEKCFRSTDQSAAGKCFYFMFFKLTWPEYMYTQTPKQWRYCFAELLVKST